MPPVFPLKTVHRSIQRVGAFCLGLALSLITTTLVAQSGPPEGPPGPDSSLDDAQMAAEMGGLGPIGSLPLILGLQAQEESHP